MEVSRRSLVVGDDGDLDDARIRSMSALSTPLREIGEGLLAIDAPGRP
jgi:hypothetical protein